MKEEKWLNESKLPSFNDIVDLFYQLSFVLEQFSSNIFRLQNRNWFKTK